MSDQAEPLKLFTVRKTRPVFIDEKEYILKEMTGPDLSAYRTGIAKRTGKDNNGASTGVITDYNGLQEALITKCLYDSDGKQVLPNAMKEWATTVIQSLFEACQDLNGLSDKARDEEKNS